MASRICLGLLLLALLAPAQDGQREPSPIRVRVDEVIVPVTVTDIQDRFVSDLKKEDFEVYDKGVKQDIRFFSAERSQPVVVGFLMDLSNASRLRWKNHLETMVELVLNLLPGEAKYSGYLIGFSNQAEVMVNTTTNSEPIVSKLNKITPGGGAALYDAIYMACTSRTLVRGEPVEPRRVIVVMGDGHDNASTKTLDQVIEIAQRELVTIFAVSTEAYGYTADSASNLRRLAEETGGRVVTPLLNVYDNTQGFLSRPSDFGNYEFKPGTGGYSNVIAQAMFKAITDIAGEITTQYIMRYVPNNASEDLSEFRRIEVRVALPNVTVRTRSGYYPTR
jgi:Ca-activated chloride channel homolog